MKRKRSSNKILSRPFIVVLIVSFALSLGMSYFFLKGKFEFDSSFIEEIASRPVKTENTERKEETRRLYELQTEDDSDNAKGASLAAVEDVTRNYMKNYGATLLGLYVDKEGILYIDLGGGLNKRFKGDASEELGIIAGLFKEIEQAMPDLKALKILMNGHEAETLGGHIDISKPIGREIAEDI